MPDFSVRWSELEARKPYASPFGVTFLDDTGATAGGIAVNGPDLLYYRQFQHAVLRLAGELFAHPAAEAAADAQRAWLDLLGDRIPAIAPLDVVPASFFDERASERRFHVTVHRHEAPGVVLDASSLLDYQEFQAMLAHNSGCLYRDLDIEAIDDPELRRRAWFGVLQGLVRRPRSDDAMAEAWPWR